MEQQHEVTQWLGKLEQRTGVRIAALFLETGPAEAPPEVVRRRVPPAVVSGATLSTGRPGSAHPLSESPTERAHRHSVARSDDPHGDTRLSSSRGLTQERERTTLAEGIDPSTDTTGCSTARPATPR